MPDSSAKPRIDSTISATERLTSSGKRSTGAGPRDVAQVVEHALQRLDFAVDRARERLAVLRDRRSTRTMSLQLLPMFWTGCDRSCTRPAAMRPNIACRSFFRTSSVSSDELVGHAVERIASCLNSSRR
jgi:hypothetical protein